MANKQKNTRRIRQAKNRKAMENKQQHVSNQVSSQLEIFASVIQALGIRVSNLNDIKPIKFRDVMHYIAKLMHEEKYCCSHCREASLNKIDLIMNNLQPNKLENHVVQFELQDETFIAVYCVTCNNVTPIPLELAVRDMTKWQVAPLPLPLNKPAIARILDINTANDTTINYGSTDYLFEEPSVRLSFFGQLLPFMAIFFYHLVIFFLEMDEYKTSFITTFYRIGVGLKEAYVIASIVSLFILAITVYGLLKKRTKPPICFNREKRQVYCTTVNGETLIADWEKMGAILETKQYPLEVWTLTLIIPDYKKDKTLSFSKNYFVESMAIAEWEAIRTYMEDGLDILKQKNHQALKQGIEAKLQTLPKNSFEYYNTLCQYYPEGSVDYFYAVKNKVKKEGSLIKYSWWLTIHIVTLWTLPCYIVQFLDKHLHLKLSKEIIVWSKPIPEEQWAKPSEELLKQTEQLQQFYAKGFSFKDVIQKNTNPL